MGLLSLSLRLDLMKYPYASKKAEVQREFDARYCAGSREPARMVYPAVPTLDGAPVLIYLDISEVE